MIKSIRYLFGYYKEYGIKCTIAYYLCILFPYSEKKRNSWRQKILKYKYKTMSNYLYKYFTQSTQNKQKNNNCESAFDGIIWTAWLQGEENAPEVIRITLASMRENANGHPVIVISNENVEQYIDIPKAIKTKHESGKMSHAHYADVIRMMILAKYGGLWLDATTFLSKPISEDAFKASFYSVGFKNVSAGKYISGGKWLVGLIGGKKGSIYISFISEMLSFYWKEHQVPIDYFVYDYLIWNLYQNDKSFCSLIESLPRMEYHTNALRRIINESFDKGRMESLLIDKQIYILSYRGEYTKKTPEGNMTLYGYLFNHYLGEQSEGE